MPKELPVTVPERRRADATIVVPSAGGALTRATSATAAPPTMRELIVPSGSVDSILGEIRKAPADRLAIESRAASGGMGAIDVAVDRALDRRIALKTLHAHLRTSESTVRMFLREARLTGVLDHPHIVPIYDIGERESDKLYFAMKLIEGQTLCDYIRALPKGPLDTATLFALLEVVTKVCDALAFAHSRGVLHCDIKPANVMVGDFGQVYLMDWGIARLVSAEPEGPPAALGSAPAAAQGRPSATDNSVIGTPCYMSPEQARGDRAKLDARSDVFLLGSLLYEILTRRPPYASADRTETLSLAAAGAFPAPRKIAKDGSVPPELERIVLRAMAKDPADRYASVIGFRDDVLQFMRGGADFPRHTYEAGETIVRDGEQGDAAYIIVAGRCDVQKETASGTEVLKTIGPGDVFGEMAILTEGPRTATVVAVERTTVLIVTAGVLEQELAALKPWMAKLLKSLAARFRDIDTKHRTTFAASPSPARLANQALMNVMTWGETNGTSVSMKWSTLGAELEAQLGLPPIAMFAVAVRYGMELDVEADRLVIPDVAALRERLARDLSR
ncbi:MAG: cyclic nucleotide-binding domain-containing protein [Labilithrix sp.]|nr:cyclic nucleotide-binding domain-containing protein [Labilithrix sp.]